MFSGGLVRQIGYRNGPLGWESIPGLLKRFTNLCSGVLQRMYFLKEGVMSSLYAVSNTISDMGEKEHPFHHFASCVYHPRLSLPHWAIPPFIFSSSLPPYLLKKKLEIFPSFLVFFSPESPTSPRQQRWHQREGWEVRVSLSYEKLAIIAPPTTSQDWTLWCPPLHPDPVSSTF